jgi:hypothetical protein
MSSRKNRRIVLASRPTGEPKAENFRLEAGAAMDGVDHIFGRVPECLPSAISHVLPFQRIADLAAGKP